jgi:hypothetical protein
VEKGYSLYRLLLSRQNQLPQWNVPIIPEQSLNALEILAFPKSLPTMGRFAQPFGGLVRLRE